MHGARPQHRRRMSSYPSRSYLELKQSLPTVLRLRHATASGSCHRTSSGDLPLESLYSRLRSSRAIQDYSWSCPWPS